MFNITKPRIALSALCLASSALAQTRNMTIWLPIPQDGIPLMTLTVLRPDWTLPHTNVNDFKVDHKYVTQRPVGKLDFAKTGLLLFEVSDTVRFWIREGDTDSPTRDMTSCVATYTGAFLELFLAPKGDLSMWRGDVIEDTKWLVCSSTDLFEMPVAGDE